MTDNTAEPDISVEPTSTVVEEPAAAPAPAAPQPRLSRVSQPHGV